GRVSVGCGWRGRGVRGSLGLGLCGAETGDDQRDGGHSVGHARRSHPRRVMAEQKSSSALTAPLRGAASVLRRVPGAGTVGRAAEETLDKIGAVSPRGRRMAVYAGAGVLGAAGVV